MLSYLTSEPEECPFCHKGRIVFRKSDEKYDINRGRKISIVDSTGGYPIWVPIDAAASGKNYYGNYGTDDGKVVPHVATCRIENFGSDDMRSHYHKFFSDVIEEIKDIRREIRDIRETAHFKPWVP